MLDIEHTEGTVTGTFAVDSAPARPFLGWLELIGLLERTASIDDPVPAAERSELKETQGGFHGERDAS